MKNDFNQFDLIYVMDVNNYNNVIKLATNQEDKSKVKLILNELYPNANMEVPDPYYGTQKEFDDVHHLLNEATDKLLSNLNQLHD